MHLSRVLITGASSGFGYQLALEFAKNGKNLFITGRNERRLSRLKKIVDQYGISCISYAADLSDHNQLSLLTNKIIEHEVDVLINNAGILCRGMPLFELDKSYVDEILNINFTVPILLTFELKKTLKVVININSICGLELKKNRSLYCATKWGLRAFSDCIKKEDTELYVLDVYPSKLAKDEKDFGINVKEAAKMVYNTYNTKAITKLVLDGRGEKK